MNPPITAVIMQENMGEKPVYCVMVAYRSMADAEEAMRLLTSPQQPCQAPQEKPR